MNIGLFTDTYFPQVSGVATSIKTLKESLEAQGHQVYIFTSTDPKVSKNKFEPHIYRFSSVPYVGFKDRRLAFRGLIQAVEIAKSVKLDIVHTQTEFSLGLLGKFVARQLKIPAVHTYHTMYEDYTHYVAKGLLIGANGVGVLMKAYMKSIDSVIAPSDLVRDTLLKYGVTAPITVIPTGVALPKRQEDNQNLRETYGFTDDNLVILSLGRLAYEKNIAMTITSFDKIIAQYPQARLVIVGDGPARKDLQEQVEHLDLTQYVTFTGMVEHDCIADYYAMSDVFVSSSNTETQGLTFVEAMFANRPFVAIHSPYLDNLVDDVAIGQLVDNIDDFTTAVIFYLNRPFNERDQAQRIKKMADVDAVTFGKRVLACYNAAIHHHQPTDGNDQFPNEEEVGYAKKLLRNPFRRGS
ncbi:glycosyltransferase family 4 protein [Leuconostoc fallax]|uniref:Glycosyltransferase subfamily 4-like N-terminal domain-containing protein n=1 Tax=Leuconostoc fallax TaxID=1251 RepID=A0A4R5NA41_9LACO|nr:glycosyltransferase family 4 protein [Leuconostoc fallax]MBU7456074.1 glycosyltransferase family 4 protein [Leuconostoc fallax]TDG68918.1 hypothetical protein C5L23_000837 [Leuconostoc fallax]